VNGAEQTEVLARMQRAFAAAVASSPGGGAVDACDSVRHDAGGAARDEAADVLAAIVPGGTLDAAGALEVYRRGYRARLTEQLGETYPSVWRVVADDDFFELCRAYIAAHPSASYTCRITGASFRPSSRQPPSSRSS
jgi:hypothetical protein